MVSTVGHDALSPRAVADAMWAQDYASRGLGMELVDVGFGEAVTAMRVRADMVNGLGVCHGGFLFILADSAMAFASNSANLVAVAASAHIDFLAPAKLDDRLIATATEQWQQGRSGIYDVVVSTDDATPKIIAVFRGRTSRTGGAVV